MTIKKIAATMTAIIFCLIFTACGASKEKIEEANAAIEEMKNAKLKTEAAYMDITDSSRKNELDILANEAEQIETTEVEKISANRIDEFITKVKELTQSYKSMESQFSYSLSQETLEKEEKAKHKYYNVYIVNKTGMNLTKMAFHDITAQKGSGNILGDGVTLQDGYTLMGCRLDIFAESTEWVFIVEDENEEEYFFNARDFIGKDLEGKSIILQTEADTGDHIATISK